MTTLPARSRRGARGTAWGLALSLVLSLALGVGSGAQADPHPPGTPASSPLDAGTGEASLALRDLWLDRDAMTGTERRRARSLLARPTTGGAHRAWRYPTDAVPERRCGPRVCVTRVTTGEHAATAQWSAQALRLVETAWHTVVDDLGYRAPAPDGDAGGDARLDVYLADLSSTHSYGFCAPETLVPGQRARTTSYCVLDNDMAGYGDPAKSLAATAAHEFFHAVQFNYDVTEDPWIMEATATWIEEQVFDDVDDNRQFLPVGQLGDPGTPLDSTRTMYGNWIFVQWIAERLGARAVREAWERMDASTGARNEWSLQALRRLVAARGGSWLRFYSDFARANLFPSRHYREGGAYRPAAVHDRLRLTPRAPSLTRTVGLSHLTSRHLQVAVPASAPTRRAVRLRIRSTRRAHAAVQVVVVRRDGSLGVRHARLGPRGRTTLRIPVGRQRVRHLLVVLSHTGADHRHCGRSSGWACGGQPVGDLRASVTARLVR